MHLQSVFAIVVGVLCYSSISYAQSAPGGVQGSTLWYKSPNNQNTIANYETVDLFQLDTALEESAALLQNTSTYFFVLKPNFSTAVGSQFMRIGTIEIFDDRISYNGNEELLSFVNGRPSIFAVVTRPQVQFARRPPSFHVELMDSSLFDIAEVVLFSERLSREEIHKVNSYLALKYSISITQNSETDWRNYQMASNDHYWDVNIDNIYDQRVLGIGNSKDEQFNQTQTTTSSGELVLVALDSVKPIGEMPAIPVAEDAFIVFSERIPQAAANLPCLFNQSAMNPLRNWKFVLHNWDSQAEHFFIRVQKPLGNLADSMFLWDGYQHWHLPATIIDSVVEYKVYFDMVQNGIHYFFVQESSFHCPQINISLDTTIQSLEVDVSTETSDSWSLKIHSLSTGVGRSQNFSGSHASVELDEGQYLATVSNSNGDEMTTQIVRVIGSSNSGEETLPVLPDIRLFPNPIKAGDLATLHVSNMPSTSNLQLIVSDASGRIIRSEPSPYQNEMSFEIAFPIAGMYQVTILQDGITYSVKAVAVQ